MRKSINKKFLYNKMTEDPFNDNDDIGDIFLQIKSSNILDDIYMQ